MKRILSHSGVRACARAPVLGLPKQCFFRGLRVFSLFRVVVCTILKKMSRSSASELSIQLRTRSRKFTFFSYLKMHQHIRFSVNKAEDILRFWLIYDHLRWFRASSPLRKTIKWCVQIDHTPFCMDSWKPSAPYGVPRSLKMHQTLCFSVK